jgi:hypothetical protein
MSLLYVNAAGTQVKRRAGKACDRLSIEDLNYSRGTPYSTSLYWGFTPNMISGITSINHPSYICHLWP